MNKTPLSSTLREMHTLAAAPSSWVVLAVVSLVVGMVGPFGTFEMPVFLRLAYWTAIVVGTAAVGTALSTLLNRLLQGYGMARYPAAIIGGAVAGVPVALCVQIVSTIFGPDYQIVDFLPLAGYCALITAAVAVLSTALRREATSPVPAVAPPPRLPPLIERLPLPQRGRLLHLAVTDHYVEVTTDRGRTLLLMRLSDAIGETAPTAGLRVHRSHWVALDAVTRVARHQGRPMIEIETGEAIPVSRTYLAAARQAGLAI